MPQLRTATLYRDLDEKHGVLGGDDLKTTKDVMKDMEINRMQ